MNNTVLYIVVLLYLGITVYLGYLGYKHTKNSNDYMLAGGNTNPFLVALSYGSTFISTSAIVGFGGAAAAYGMSLLWLTFFNIVVGIFVAFVFFGKRTRVLGKKLQAKTFPELMAKRFNSKFIQLYSAILVCIAMPLYAAAVMIGGGRFMEQALNIDYKTALTILAVLVGFYVLFGGLKGIIYTDAFQGGIMFIGMLALLVVTYSVLGGVTGAHEKLVNLSSMVPQSLIDKGHTGWASMPVFGSELWLYVITTLVMGVGIGVLAQPHLAVRFMTLGSNREINRAVVVGSIFILAMTGVAFAVGALSNVYFFDTEGKIALAVVTDPVSGLPNIDKIIPLYISQALPDWFAYIFMLSLLSAAMSTLSGQFHAIGTSVRDIFEARGKNHEDSFTTNITKVGVVVALVSTLLLSFKLPVSIIAIATAMFFGLCAASFLPMYVAALYWPRATKTGIISGMVSGTTVYLLILFFVHQKEAAIFGLSELIFGKPFLFGFPWNIIDPIVIALPIGAIVMVATSLLTVPYQVAHLENCFTQITTPEREDINPSMSNL